MGLVQHEKVNDVPICPDHHLAFTTFGVRGIRGIRGILAGLALPRP